MKQFPDTDRFSWNRDTDNFDVLRSSDVMISDFSGVIFDYALVFDKPVIYHNAKFDKGPYDSYWLKDELWTLETLPRIGKCLDEGMLDRIKESIDDLRDNPAYQKARDRAREEVWMHPGEGAVRAADYLMEKLRELEQEQPQENK